MEKWHLWRDSDPSVSEPEPTLLAQTLDNLNQLILEKYDEFGELAKEHPGNSLIPQMHYHAKVESFKYDLTVLELFRDFLNKKIDNLRQ